MHPAERAACDLVRPSPEHFNPSARLPHGCTVEAVRNAMAEFLDFLEFINTQLHSRQLPRLECFLMPATFSGIVGEFMSATIPKHCPTLVKNGYHNGHPDLIPAGRYERDAVQHGEQGVEIKGSRYLRGWQGHNAEAAWLMVLAFEANRGRDEGLNVPPTPFRFLKIVGAKLETTDWLFSGRSPTSRRTITASVTTTGFNKVEGNWIYRLPGNSNGSETESTSESTSGTRTDRKRRAPRTPKS